MIRTATEIDALNIASLSIQVWLNTYARKGLSPAISQYVTTEFTESNITDAIKSSDKNILVSLNEDYLVGYALLNLAGICPATHQTLPELERLYVHENFTHQGIGTELLKSTLKGVSKNSDFCALARKDCAQ